MSLKYGDENQGEEAGAEKKDAPAGARVLPGPEDLGFPQPPPAVANKLGLVKFNLDREPHLRIKDAEVCRRRCRQKFCTHSCPAQVYHWESEGKKISVAYEGCLECGTCRSGGCPYDNIEMRYPRGGYGVQYRFG